MGTRLPRAGGIPATAPFLGLLHPSFLHPSLVHLASEITPMLNCPLGIYYDSNSPDSFPQDSKVRSPSGKRGNHVHSDQCCRSLPNPGPLLFFGPWWGLCLSPPNTGARPTFYIQTSPQPCTSRRNTSLLVFPLCVFQGVFDSARGALKLASLAKKKKKDETLRGCQAGQGNQKSTQAMAGPAQLKQSPSFSSSSRLQRVGAKTVVAEHKLCHLCVSKGSQHSSVLSFSSGLCKYCVLFFFFFFVVDFVIH